MAFSLDLENAKLESPQSENATSQKFNGENAGVGARIARRLDQ
jgi:hypothetical protein